eukprot:1063017-Alexandrium_andersonii.AAC.1
MRRWEGKPCKKPERDGSDGSTTLTGCRARAPSPPSIARSTHLAGSQDDFHGNLATPPRCFEKPE